MDFLWTLSEIRTPFLNELFSWITRLGEEIIAVVLICTIFWCIDKALAYKIGISYFISALLVQGIKITMRIERPWIIDPEFKAVPSALGGATGYSFPSGHTQGAAAIYGTIAWNVKNIWIRTACIAAFLAVGFSRMYLGVHTPADVAVGFALAAVCTVLVCIYYRGEEISRNHSLVLSLVVLCGSIILLGYSFYLYKSGVIEREYVSDCCKAAGAGIGCACGFYTEANYINFSVKCKNIWMHILKVVLGLAGVVILRSGIKAVFGTSLAVDTLRYVIIIFWVLAIWPLVIKKFFSVSPEQTEIVTE